MAGLLDFFSPEAGQRRTSAPNRFGDVGSRYGNESLQAAGDMLSNKVNLYDALPSSMQGGVMEPVNRTIMNAATLGAGGLMGLFGLVEKGLGYGSEFVAGGTESEKRLARDFLGGMEVAGIGPEARALAALSGSASQQASRAAIDRLNQPGPVPTMYSNPLGGVKPSGGATAGPVTPYADIPVLDPRDFIGAKLSPTPADLTRAGEFYKGIDAAGTTRKTPLLGGPLFPTQQAYSDADIAWLVDSASKGSAKLGKDSDFVTVTAMSPKAHQSNASVADAYMGTLEAYIKSGRLPEQSVAQLSDLVRGFGRTTTDPELQRLSNFVGFESPDFNEFMRNATFPQREAISKLMTSPASQAIGGPSMQKVLDATIQPEFAGSNLGDTLLLLELDKQRGLLNLAEEGLPEHMSYNTGLGGRVVGRFENPAARGLVYPDFEAEYSARPTMVNKSGGLDEARMSYSFGRALPVQTITPEGARNLNEAMQNYGFEQPQQAKLIQDAIANQWRSSATPKTKGGISPVNFERALLRNPSLPSLEPYTAADVTRGAKAGDFEVFQLGDADVFFGLKKSPDYSWMNNGDPVPGLSQDEVGLSAVVSNEMGAKGVASPAILGKAIEEGVTVLDAFAVPSERFPQGFLPSTYENYGFGEVTRIPFSKEFYIQDRGQDAFDDLIRQWRSEGWDESKGFPDVVLMKWSGTDADRANAGTKVFEPGFEGFGPKEDIGFIPTAEQTPESGVLSAVEEKAGKPDIGRGDTGPARSGGGAYQPHRLRGAAETLRNLTPLQRKNLGLLSIIPPQGR